MLLTIELHVQLSIRRSSARSTFEASDLTWNPFASSTAFTTVVGFANSANRAQCGSTGVHQTSHLGFANGACGGLGLGLADMVAGPTVVLHAFCATGALVEFAWRHEAVDDGQAVLTEPGAWANRPALVDTFPRLRRILFFANKVAAPTVVLDTNRLVSGALVLFTR
jgi:hypothetical protein